MNIKSKLAGIIINVSSFVIITGYGYTLYPSGIHNWMYSYKETDSLNLPVSQYEALNDSILTMRNLKNGYGFDHDNGQFAYLGTQTSIACDTCSYTWFKNNTQTYNQNYIKLNAWGIKKELPYKFYVKNKQGYVRKAVPVKNSDSKFNIVDVPVKFRYNTMDDAILIPVSADGASLFDTGWLILWGLNMIGLLFLLYLFIRFSYDTSKGRLFTRKNVTRLKLIAVSVTVYPLSIILLNLLVRFVFRQYFSPEVVLKDMVWYNAYIVLLIGIVLSLLYGAYNRAQLLQEEQDLTV
ncbi:MAG: hypothetical protein JWQ34_2967 [Mucilaginibacter sp.]|uniref:DUF2975 domain-containing protein n=1 Tax=Mucilaginibacter sp. TaxID=1882438 RepID=UPI002636A425|nr:DUF2975 domain-containing protein [Mucilaginibacter sp.]MDB5004742.1 hypothetical protein [Mucilaginibacter sp.]